jgi:hypothetical protein
MHNKALPALPRSLRCSWRLSEAEFDALLARMERLVSAAALLGESDAFQKVAFFRMAGVEWFDCPDRLVRLAEVLRLTPAVARFLYDEVYWPKGFGANDTEPRQIARNLFDLADNWPGLDALRDAVPSSGDGFDLTQRSGTRKREALAARMAATITVPVLLAGWTINLNRIRRGAA